MDQRISLITLGVADLRRAIDFYAGLGWEGSSPDGDVAFFQAGGMVFALWSRDKLAADSGIEEDRGGWGGVTLAHLVRSPDRRRRGARERACRRRHGPAPRRRDVLGRLLGHLLRSRRPPVGDRPQPRLDARRGRDGAPRLMPRPAPFRVRSG